MTPAQKAKDYAVLHGYKIVPNGRRYDVWTDYDGDEYQNHIANVGSYPAALNAMISHRDALPLCKGDNCTSNGVTPHSPECIAEHDRVTGAARSMTMEHYRNIEANTREHFANINAMYGKFATSDDPQRSVIDAAEEVFRDVSESIFVDMYREIFRQHREIFRQHRDSKINVALDVNPRDVVDGQIVRGVGHVTVNGQTESRAFGLDDPQRPNGVTPQEWEASKGDPAPRAAHYTAPPKDMGAADEVRPVAADNLLTLRIAVVLPTHRVVITLRNQQQWIMYGASRGEVLTKLRRYMSGRNRMNIVNQIIERVR